MSINDENLKYDVGWICPACNINTNAQGLPFLSSRALALHIAGKILSYDYKFQHRNWAAKVIGSNINNYADYNINTLANKLERYVLEDYEARCQYEEEKIKLFVKYKGSIEEPSVLAYKYVRELETRLHSFLRQILEEEYGEAESEWWVKGIPLQIRTECVKRKENDILREEAYNYVDLIDLKSILDKNWRVFEPQFKLPKDFIHDKKDLLNAIDKLNELRKRVMHPTRLTVSDDNIGFLKRFADIIEDVINLRLMKSPDLDKVLIEIQKNTKIESFENIDSLRWFYDEGLTSLIFSKFPIKHKRGLELALISFEWHEPDYNHKDCKELGFTYAYSLYTKTRLLVRYTSEIKEQDIYLADIPRTTPKNTCSINGKEQSLIVDSLNNQSINQGSINKSLDSLIFTVRNRMQRIPLAFVTPSSLFDIQIFITGINEFFASILKSSK